MTDHTDPMDFAISESLSASDTEYQNDAETIVLDLLEHVREQASEAAQESELRLERFEEIRSVRSSLRLKRVG